MKNLVPEGIMGEYRELKARSCNAPCSYLTRYIGNNNYDVYDECLFIYKRELFPWPPNSAGSVKYSAENELSVMTIRLGEDKQPFRKRKASKFLA